jgi:hypothetical protein
MGTPLARPRWSSGELCRIVISAKSPCHPPYHVRIQCGDHLTPFPDTRASVGKVEMTAVTSPFYCSFWQDNNTIHPVPTTMPATRVRLTTVSYGLSRVRPRAQQGAPLRPTPASASRGVITTPDPGPGLNLGLGRRSPPRPTSASASGGVTASPDLSLGLGRSHRLARNGFGLTTLQGICHYPTPS